MSSALMRALTFSLVHLLYPCRAHVTTLRCSVAETWATVRETASDGSSWYVWHRSTMLRNRRRYPKTYLRPPCPTKNKVVPLRAARSEFKNLSIMDAISFIQGQVSRETKLPAFRAGDTVIVDYRITEGEKSRIQQFRGDVIQIKGEGLTKTFTVRKISNGIGVERIFPLSSPAIDGLTIVKHGKVRRSRLFYLRDRVGKKARIKERRIK